MYITKRKGIYQLFYTKPDGRLSSISTKTKVKSEALKFLTQFEQKIREREKLGVTPIRLKDFAWEYLKYSESVHRPKTTLQLKTIFKSLQDFTGSIDIHCISHSQMQQYLNSKTKVSAFTAQKHLAYLKAAFNRAIDLGYLKENPCQKVKPFRLPEKQPLFFSEADFQTLLCAIEDKDLKDLIRFSVNVGCRQMEILTLKWVQTDLKGRFIIIDNRDGFLSKSKKVRPVPLNTEAMSILLDRQKDRTGDFVFTYKGKPITQDFISKKFKKFVLKANLNPGLHFHSLRHSFGSWLIQRGASIYNVSKLLGHSDIKTTEIYLHVSAENLRSSVNLLENT